VIQRQYIFFLEKQNFFFKIPTAVKYFVLLLIPRGRMIGVHMQEVQLFSRGDVFATIGAIRAMKSLHIPSDLLLIRHLIGDWVEMSQEERQANKIAIENGEKIRSRYSLGEHVFTVTTEANRSKTTIRLAYEDFTF
jgi:hypothetical protein